MENRELYKILEEEIRSTDLSTTYSEANIMQEIIIIALEDTVVSGVNIIRELLNILDEDAVIKVINPDGFKIEEGDIIAIIKAKTTTILQLDQLIYNIIESMCAIASKTNQYVKKLNGTDIKLIDKRINIPGARYITKLAFLDGGGINHYGNLSDHIFLNANHKALYNSFENALNVIKKHIDQNVKCTIEVNNQSDFFEAIKCDCQIISLNSFDPKIVNELLSNQELNQLVEVSINLNDYSIEDYINNNIDFISIDDITESYNRKKIQIKYIK